MRNTTIVALALLAASCVRLAHIQQTQPIRTLQFTGDHKIVAQCVQQRLGGKVQEESLAERYVIYDSAKTHESEGLTHYAVTVGKSGPDKGFAEWRIMRPARQAGPGTPARPLSRAMIDEYWGPVQQCAKQAKPSQPSG